MAHGIRTFDASGNILMDTDTNMGRILGMTTTGTSNGSVTNADFAQGTPFWIAIVNNTTANNTVVSPDFSFSGTTLTWTHNTYSGDTRLIYGVY